MRITTVAPRAFRNLAGTPVELGEAITVVHGPNGSGKTNLLEAIFFGLTGHPCRAGAVRDLIAYQQPAARVELTLSDSRRNRTLLASAARDGERRHLLDGASAPRGGEGRPPASVFLPDRIALVKGPPAHRRAHLDRFVAALWPARSDLRQRFGRALAQRNALVSRVAAGAASAASLAAWDEKLAAEAAPLTASRAEAVKLLAEPFADAARALGLGEQPGAIAYRPRGPLGAPELLEELARRRQVDLSRAYLSFGPQLDEVTLELGDRPLRRFGSQGQQRIALLSLLFAEREVLIDAHRPPPLMLLDDVMSELDPDHRSLLLQRLTGAGQAVITATEPEAIPNAVPWVSLAMRRGEIVDPASHAGAGSAKALAVDSRAVERAPEVIEDPAPADIHEAA
ncbi:MAG: DNA replication/repair protein RecF [Solirubrobacterales bacterium]